LHPPRLTKTAGERGEPVADDHLRASLERSLQGLARLALLEG
jgi:hypothetical protein